MDKLLRKIKQESENAFKIIFESYYSGLLRYANSYINDIYSAENIVQDAFVILWEKRKSIPDETPIQSYLIKIVKYKIWNHLETNKRRLSILEGIYASKLNDVKLKIESLRYDIDILELKEIQIIINKTLNTFSEQTKEIFNLSREQFLTNREIAEKLNLSEKAIEYHISKVLKQLKTALSDYLYLFFLLFL